MRAESPAKLVYFRRELPPLQDETAGEFVVEAESPPVPNTGLGRDELWTHCYDDLMHSAVERIGQEVVRTLLRRQVIATSKLKCHAFVLSLNLDASQWVIAAELGRV